MKKSTTTSGFTLIEIIITVLVISVVASAGVAAWPDRMALRSQAEMVAHDLRYVRSLSISRGEPYQMALLSGQYQIQRVADGSVVSSQDLSDFSLYGGFPVRFDGLGRPTNFGGKILVKGSDAMLVFVWPETGGIVVD